MHTKSCGGSRTLAADGRGNDGTDGAFFSEEFAAFRSVEAVEHGGSQVAGRAVEDDFAFLAKSNIG